MPIYIYGENNPDLAKFKVSGDATIWRYMDIGKYLDVITRGQIWFSRAIIFRGTDPYEGSLTEHDRKTMVDVLSVKTKEELQSVLPAFSTIISHASTKSLYWFQALFLTKLRLLDINLYGNSISCWHENPSESDAMWALYAQRDAGIAIKSTVNRVLNAFGSSARTICIAKVNYDSAGGLSVLTSGSCDSLLIKRHAFHHENEVRIIASTFDGYEDSQWTEEKQTYLLDITKPVPAGVYIDCDIQSLVEEVVISPLTPAYSARALESISKRLAPNIVIRKSTLLTRDEDIFQQLFSRELFRIWDHHLRTNLLLDIDEIPS